MKIDSGLNGYYYPNRTQVTDRPIEEATQHESTSFQRSPNALTGSSTLLSASLSNALWVMEAGETSNNTQPAAPAVPSDWVEGIYQEFA